MAFRNENFDAIVAGQIDPKSYDLVLSQVTITPDRAKVVDFSEGYFKSRPGLVGQQGHHGDRVGRHEEVDHRRAGIDDRRGSTSHPATMPGWKLDNVKSFPDLASAYAALSAGTVDGVMIDTPINLGQAAQSSGKQEVVAQFKTGEEYGAIYGKGTDKKAIFDPIIQGLIDDGSVNALIAKYLGGDPSTVPFVDVPTS